MINKVTEQSYSDYLIYQGLSRTQSEHSYAKSKNKLDSATSPTEYKGMVINREGDLAYLKEIDLDEDGSITMSEFNQFCDEHSISTEDRIALMKMVQSSQMYKEDESETEEDETNLIKTEKEKSDDKKDDYKIQEQGKKQETKTEPKNKGDTSTTEVNDDKKIIDFNYKKAIKAYKGPEEEGAILVKDA